MSSPVVLPKLGYSMSEGTLTEWLAADGATVQQGQLLYVLESEKSAQEVEAPAGGKLKILKPSGAAYPVGTVLAEIG